MVTFTPLHMPDNMVFTLGPSAHLPTLATRARLGTISDSSDIVRFVQGGVVKTFRWPRVGVMAAHLNQLVNDFQKKTRKAFRFLERDFGYQFVGVKQSGLEFYPRDGRVGVRFANPTSGVGVEVELGADTSDVHVCLVELEGTDFPDEYTVFGHRQWTQAIELQSFVETSTQSEIETILPRFTWQLTANKSTRLGKKRRGLIEFKLQVILDELSNLLAEHGESVLRGDTSSFPEVQKHHCQAMGCRLTKNGTWLETMVNGKWLGSR